MSEPRNLRVEPTGATHATGPLQPAREQPTSGRPEVQPRPEPAQADAVAAVGGHLRGAYAEYVVDPATNDVVVRIRDLATDRVLNELPSPEVQALSRHLREYAETLARRRIATGSQQV